MGIWPQYSDGTDINALDVSPNKSIVIHNFGPKSHIESRSLLLMISEIWIFSTTLVFPKILLMWCVVVIVLMSQTFAFWTIKPLLQLVGMTSVSLYGMLAAPKNDSNRSEFYFLLCSRNIRWTGKRSTWICETVRKVVSGDLSSTILRIYQTLAVEFQTARAEQIYITNRRYVIPILHHFLHRVFSIIFLLVSPVGK